MTQLLLAPAAARRTRNFAEQQPDSRVFGGEGITLGERISSIWEVLLATGTADCPVCRGRLERMGDRGRCLSCNSLLG